MDELGFGATAFTLSMIETALRIGGESLPVSAVSDIYAVGRSLLKIPATPLEGVEETLHRLAGSRRFRLVVLTKGNLLDQERKLERSGLGRYFDHVEIVSDKNEKAYSDFVAFLGIDASEMDNGRKFVQVGHRSRLGNRRLRRLYTLPHHMAA